MKILMTVACFVFCFSMLAQLSHAAAEPQVFPTSAGPVKITPLNHASTLIEAGGKMIYLDPAKPAKLTGLPKADLILITDIHGDHMDPDSIKEISKADTEIFAAAGRRADGDFSQSQLPTARRRPGRAWTIEAIPAYNLKRGPAAGKTFS